MYTQNLKLKHNEVPAKIDMETGEVITISRRVNNLPEGKSKLDYDRFHIKNDNLSNLVRNGIITHEENSIISLMCSMAEMGTNALKPITDETSLLLLADEFSVNRNRIGKVIERLRTLGVFLQIRYFSHSQQKDVTYWVLNPNISWKGRLKDDSIFNHFHDTTITKLLN